MQNRTTGEIVTRAQELNDIKNLVADVFTNKNVVKENYLLTLKLVYLLSELKIL